MQGSGRLFFCLFSFAFLICFLFLEVRDLVLTEGIMWEDKLNMQERGEITVEAGPQIEWKE